MPRKKYADLTTETEPDFRYRGKDGSRIENVSDAVFAFALTLIVFSLKVPESFDELWHSFKGIIAFLICAITLFQIWREHHTFFIRYGLRDEFTINLNAVLLFLILFYIHPLKFLFSLLIEFIQNLYSVLVLGVDPGLLSETGPVIITGEEMPRLMLMYCGGAVGVFLLFTALYWHALRKKDVLKLNRAEVVHTKVSIRKNLFLGSVPLLSATMVIILRNNPALASTVSGMVFSLYGLYHPVVIRYEKKLRSGLAGH